MTYVNPINYSNFSTWNDIIAAPNVGTGGWFWTITIYLVFIVATSLIAIGGGLEAGLMIGAFIALVPALILAMGNLISWWVVGSLVGVELFFIIYTIVHSPKNY